MKSADIKGTIVTFVLDVSAVGGSANLLASDETRSRHRLPEEGGLFEHSPGGLADKHMYEAYLNDFGRPAPYARSIARRATPRSLGVV